MNIVTDGYLDHKQGGRDIGQNVRDNGEEGVDSEQNGEGN